MKQSLWLGWVLFLFLICTGCGDTFRPVIIPNPPAFPDPRASHTAVAISNNGAVEGSAMVINVTGDSKVSVADCSGGSPCLGIAPVHAVQQTATQVLVVNQAAPGKLGDSLSKVSFSGTVIAAVTSITLPADSAPNFVSVLPGASTAYVTLPNYVPDPVNNPGVVVPSVGEVNTSSNAMTATIPVGDNPVAIAETPDKSKLYVANRGSNSITGANTLDRSIRPIDLDSQPNPFAEPDWIVVRSDNRRVYVLNGSSGSLVTLDPTWQAGTTDKVLHPLLNVGASEYMFYDAHLNRIYVPSDAQVAIVDVSADLPRILGNGGNPLPITALDPANRSDAGDPCALTTVTALNTVAVAALPDGTRAYVGSFYEDSAGNICPQVTVINTSSNTVKTTIAVPGFPNYDTFCATTRFRFTMAAGGDSSRVYLASCDSGGVHILDTSNDSYIAALPAPPSVRPHPPGTQPPPQNPVFLIAGP